MIYIKKRKTGRIAGKRCQNSSPRSSNAVGMRQKQNDFLQQNYFHWYLSIIYPLLLKCGLYCRRSRYFRTQCVQKSQVSASKLMESVIKKKLALKSTSHGLVRSRLFQKCFGLFCSFSTFDFPVTLVCWKRLGVQFSQQSESSLRNIPQTFPQNVTFQQHTNIWIWTRFH